MAQHSRSRVVQPKEGECYRAACWGAEGQAAGEHKSLQQLCCVSPLAADGLSHCALVQSATSTLLQVRFIVMNNLFQTDLQIQRCYDLKGSTQGRFSGKAPSPGTVLKDLDLDICLKLEEGWHDK